jgi:hypothetical protein
MFPQTKSEIHTALVDVHDGDVIWCSCWRGRGRWQQKGGGWRCLCVSMRMLQRNGLQLGTLIDQRGKFKIVGGGERKVGVEGRRNVFEGKSTLRDFGKARFLASSLSAARGTTTRNHFQHLLPVSLSNRLPGCQVVDTNLQIIIQLESPPKVFVLSPNVMNSF